jgi:hypothetical protein
MNQETSRLTIVVPTYNRISLLRKLVASLNSQSCLSYDLTIWDNASNDGSWEMLNDINWAVKGKVSIKRNQQNLGAAGSMDVWRRSINTGWCTVVCDDDWLGLDFVRFLYAGIAETKSDIVVGGHSRVSKSGECVYRREYVHGTEVASRCAIEQFRSGELTVAGISGFAVKSIHLTDSSFAPAYAGGFLVDTLLCLRAMSVGGAYMVRGTEYNRLEWSGAESRAPDRALNWLLAEEAFGLDVASLSNRVPDCRSELMAWSPRARFTFFKNACFMLVGEGGLVRGQCYIKKSKLISNGINTRRVVFRVIYCILRPILLFKWTAKFLRSFRSLE